MEWLSDPQVWTGLLTLTVLEIVLGIDNIVFVSILAANLPGEKQPMARKGGLMLALVTRVLLLCTISWLVGLTEPLFAPFGHEFSGKDIILLLGGLFLLGKSVHEIHGKLETAGGHHVPKPAASILVVMIQISLFDIIFSLDSVITAVGLVDRLPVMIAAVVIAMIVMIAAVGPISHFVEKHPTLKMLALSFLLLIGLMLVAEGMGQHIPKGYIYFAMGFAVFVEILNIRTRKPHPHVERLQGAR